MDELIYKDYAGCYGTHTYGNPIILINFSLNKCHKVVFNNRILDVCSVLHIICIHVFGDFFSHCQFHHQNIYNFVNPLKKDLTY